MLGHFGEQQHEKDTKSLYKIKAPVNEVQASVVEQQPAKQQQQQARQQQHARYGDKDRNAPRATTTSAPSDPRKCYSCGSEEHVIRDYPQKKDQPKNEAQNRSTKSDGQQAAPSGGNAAPSCNCDSKQLTIDNVLVLLDVPADVVEQTKKITDILDTGDINECLFSLKMMVAIAISV